MGVVLSLVLVLAVLAGAWKIVNNGIVTNRPGDSAVSRAAEAAGRLVIVGVALAIAAFVAYVAYQASVNPA